MKLDRNINGTGRGKYGLIKTRAIGELKALADRNAPNAATAQLRMNMYVKALSAIAALEELGVIEWGEPGTEGEFFVIKLRDRCAQRALETYAAVAFNEVGREYSDDVLALADRSGIRSPFCKKPD